MSQFSARPGDPTAGDRRSTSDGRAGQPTRGDDAGATQQLQIITTGPDNPPAQPAEQHPGPIEPFSPVSLTEPPPGVPPHTPAAPPPAEVRATAGPVRGGRRPRLTRRRLLGAGAGLLVVGAGGAGAGLLIGREHAGEHPGTGAPGTPDSMADEVDPLIGTASPGNTYPGAHLPFGFVAPSPDTERPSSAGYSPGQPIVGFSQTHVSGTGGDSRYGNVRITPAAGRARLDRLRSGSRDEHAEPGYYRVRLTDAKVLAELTATRGCALHRYTFPDAAGGQLVVDASSVIAGASSQVPSSSSLRIVGDNQLEGSVTVTGGWGDRGGHYTLHFAAELDRSFTRHATFTGTRSTDGRREVHGGRDERVGAVLTVPTPVRHVVELRVAMSFTGIDHARAALRSEVGMRDFDAVRRAAADAWRAVLGRAVVHGGSRRERTIFATALYHCHLMPHDVSDDNAWWSSKKPHYEDFYTLWDTTRGLHPLLTLLQPERQADMVSSLIDTYVHTGWLPDARIAGANCYIQGGTNGDVLVADALVKKLPGIDYRSGYHALRKDGEHNSPRPQVEGRDLDDYLRLGYLPVDRQLPDDPHGNRCASRTLEYAYEDFCISRVARHFGDGDVADRYLRRSLNWSKLFDSDTGLIRPRHSDGTWLSPFDPADADNKHFYEGNAYQYSTFVPHDVQGLIRRMGGDGKFVAFLDALFDRHRYDPANEPDLLAAFLYLHAGRPDRTADVTRRLLAEQYTAAADGLPGNDDAGAMSAWYVWTALGLYPNPGHDWYYLTSPLFPAATLRLGEHRTLRITADGASEATRYVRSVRLGGKPVHGPWVHHADLLSAGTLDFALSDRPADWGRSHRPPSVTHR